MKKFLLMAVVAFGMLATACSKDEVAQPVVGGEESIVTFTVEAPVMATRAHGDGLTATQLSWAVYDKTHNLLFQSSEPTVMSGLTATVEIPFVNGMAYNILFWAEAEQSPYSVEWANLEVGYTNAAALVSNSEKYDAFYCYFTELGAVTGPVNEDVELKRPFAQLNIITNDATEAAQSGLTVDQVSVEISEGCDKFNLADGEGIKAAAGTKITFTNAAKLADDHLAVNYLFTGGQKSLVNVTFAYTDSEAKGGDASGSMEFASVPVQRNYRTNIVGSLLTSEGNFNIETKPGFDGEPGHEYGVVSTAEAAQYALDHAVPGTTIQLAEGVNYGTLYLRPSATNPSTKVIDWVGNNYHYETLTVYDNVTIVGAEGATVDAIKIEGGTYYNTPHSQSSTYPVMLSLIELKNFVVDGVTFTGKGGYDPQGYGNAINLSGNNIKVNGLTVKNCILDNNDNNARFIYKTEGTSHVHNYTYDGEALTFIPSQKDITMTGCTLNGGYIGIELRETENVTITNNTFNVANRNILLPVNSGFTYSGNVNIIGNVSNKAQERFVRADGMGDAVVVIKDNTILDYEAADADYIKVTNGNNVTIENNIFGRAYYSLILAPNGTNSQIIVSDKEGLLKLTELFANWTALFTDGNGGTYTNYANGAGVDFYYAGRWTINLVADIDLNNESIDPIIIKHPVSAGAPVFNGNNHQIKNATIVTDPNTENEAGLFNASAHITMKKLKLDSIHVTGSNVGNSTAGILSGSVAATVQDITITNSSVIGGKYTGGVVGYGYTDVLNCELNNVVVKGGYKLGGLIGYICASGSSTGDVTGNTLTDCEVNGIGGGVYAGGKSEYIIGKLVGNYNCNGTCQNNTVVNMTTDATNNIGKIEASVTVVE
ncbi:MAG: hypothetical protein IJ998_03855 [Alistipes sp.]|nr:hypothetical protein [Alistipes sp.]